MDLFARQKNRGLGSLRTMADRAADRGHPISFVQLGEYASGKLRSFPNEDTRRAIAAALDVSLEEVAAAAVVTAAPELANGEALLQLQDAQAFLRLTSGRSRAEVTQLLGVVEAALRAIDAGK